jgi:hypothetical protein
MEGRGRLSERVYCIAPTAEAPASDVAQADPECRATKIELRSPVAPSQSDLSIHTDTWAQR